LVTFFKFSVCIGVRYASRCAVAKQKCKMRDPQLKSKWRRFYISPANPARRKGARFAPLSPACDFYSVMSGRPLLQGYCMQFVLRLYMYINAEEGQVRPGKERLSEQPVAARRQACTLCFLVLGRRQRKKSHHGCRIVVYCCAAQQPSSLRSPPAPLALRRFAALRAPRLPADPRLSPPRDNASTGCSGSEEEVN
jgi:hypothetical protein